MAKAIKLPDGYYWDSTGVTHNRVSLDELLTSKVLYSRSKTYTEVANNTVINLSDDITKYSHVIIYGKLSDGNLGSVELYKPAVNDVFTLDIHRSGGQTGAYAWSAVSRDFYITGTKQIKYGVCMLGHSALGNHDISVEAAPRITIYAVIGYKF